MGFRNNSYAKVWDVKLDGKYPSANISISKKNQQTGEYDKQFGGFVSFIGPASEMAVNLKRGDYIHLLSTDVTNRYDKQMDKMVVYYTVFEYEDGNGRSGNSSIKATSSKKEDAAYEGDSQVESDDDCGGDMPF